MEVDRVNEVLLVPKTWSRVLHPLDLGVNRFALVMRRRRYLMEPQDGKEFAQNDPRWALLIPVIDAAWYSITRYLKEQKLIQEEADQKAGPF